MKISTKLKLNFMLILYLFFSIIKCGVIIPDSSNPFLIHRANLINSGFSHVLYFNFQLPDGSTGLGFKQIIAAQFTTDSNIKAQLDLDTNGNSDGTTSKYSCALYDITTPTIPIAISVVSLTPFYGEGSTFLCRIEDYVNNLTPGRNYGLKINLIRAAFSSAISKIKQISLFTTSSTINPSERIIIDYNPSFAESALYSDFSTQVLPPLAIASTTTQISATANSNFTLSFNVICNSIIKGTESNFIIQWDPIIIIAEPNLIVSSSDSTYINPTALQKAYSGSLSATLINGSNGAAIITGIGDDLVAKRTFKINISGFTAKFIPTSSASQISLTVYYKNSYSVISYSKFNLVNINSLSFISTSALPYDGWSSIRQGGAWNIQFSFIPSASYSSSGYVVLRQINAEININKLNFLASTCDFTPMIPKVIPSNEFGVRPICSPLRMDYNYKDTNNNNVMTGVHDGSGILFQLPRLNAVLHTFNVFIFAEFCVAQNSVATSPIFGLDMLDNIYGQYFFSLAFYKSADPNKLNEYRFNPNNIVIPPSKVNSGLFIRCIGNFWPGYSTARGSMDISLTYQKSTSQNTSAFIYKEISDFVIPYIISNNQSGNINHFFNNITNPANTSFIFGSLLSTINGVNTSTVNLLNGKSYLAVLGEVQMNFLTSTNHRSICSYIACAKIYQSTQTPQFISPTSFKMEFSLANKQEFFTVGDPINSMCYFSWGFGFHTFSATSSVNNKNTFTNPTVSNNPLQTQITLLTSTNSNSVYPTTQSSSGSIPHQKNMVAKLKNINNPYDIGSPSSTLITVSPIQITSINFSNDSYVSFPSLTDSSQPFTTSNGQSFHFAVLNTCVKWVQNNSPLSLITSIYNYIDVQLNVQEQASNNIFYTTKVNRFFKFVIDSYILDHKKQIVATADNIITWHVINNPMTFAHQTGYPSFSNINKVCLIQISSEIYQNLSPGANTLVIFFTYLMLLETDFTDITSTYPINSTKVLAYAVNSLPFYIGQSYTIPPSIGSLNDGFYNYAWYKADYVSYGGVSLTSGNDYSIIGNHSSDYGLPVNYAGNLAISNQVKNGFILPVNEFVSRSISKLFLGSALWINVGSNPWKGTNGAFTGDIIFPTFCPVLTVEYQNNVTSTPSFHYQSLIQLNFFNAWGFLPRDYDIMYVPRSSTSVQNCVGSGSQYFSNLTDTCIGSYWSSSIKFSSLSPFSDLFSFLGSSDDMWVLTVLRFQAYNSNTIGNNLQICAKCSYGSLSYNPTKPVNSNDTACSGYNLFINNRIVLDINSATNLYVENRVLSSTGDGNNSFLWNADLNKGIYLGGKKWNRLFMSTILTPVSLGLGLSQQTSQFYTGFVRPQPGTVIIQNNSNYVLYLSDSFAFYCSSYRSVDGNYFFTNYNPNEENLGSNYDIGTFIVDWTYRNSLNIMEAMVLGPDSGTAYKNDIAGNLRITLKFPLSITLPGSNITKFYLQMLNLGINSICGINYSTASNNAVAETCLYNTNDSVFSCALNGKSSETGIILICCYGASINSDSINFPNSSSGNGSLLINFSSNFPSILTQTNPLNYTYNLNGVSLTSSNNWFTGNTNNPNPLLLTSGSIYKPSITMSSIIAQEGAYSKVTLTIGLGREAVRNSNIVITGGDLSGFSIKNMNTRCSASFQIVDTSLDRLIDGCTLILTSTGSISVRIGNRVVKCGISLPKTIYIYLWPVQTIKDTSASTYTVQMLFPATSATPTNILQAPFSTSITNFSVLPNNIPAVSSANRNLSKLCDVTSISPLVVNESGDFTFNFDFSTVAANGKVPNEVFIFFPYPTFYINAGINTAISCYIDSNFTPCSTLEDNWLKISIPSTASLTNNQQILIVGIPIPSTNGNIVFSCSANYIDSNNIRTVLVTGSGTFVSAYGIIDPPSNNGLLRIISVKSGTSEPRTINSLTFVVSFDTTILAGQTFPSTISNFPYILITLPFPDFILNWYNNNSITATVTEWNLLSGATSPTSISLLVGTVVANSNKIYIPLGDFSRTLNSATFQNWTIFVSGIPQPSENSAVTTGRFRITISNRNTSSLYRGYVNLSSVFGSSPLLNAFDNISGYNTNNLITFPRGLTYTFSSSKTIIDVNDCMIIGSNGFPSRNYIYLRPGRANTCYFTIRPSINNIKVPQTPVTISIQTSLFAMNGSVTLNPSSGKAQFMIGVPCSTMPGTYVATFTISDISNYYPPPPVIICVDTIGNPSNVSPPLFIPDTAAGGYSPVTFTMSDYNIDSLFYNFFPDTQIYTPTQDTSSAIVNAVTLGNPNSTFRIPPFSNSFSGFFQITNSTAIGNQKFIGNTTNNCFSPQFTITFTVNSKQQNMSNIDISKSFSDYMNGDSQNTTISKNSIQFNFTPPVAPMFINCMLICSSMTFVDSQIMTNNGFTTSPLVSYISQYIPSVSSSSKILFSGLVRGLSYQMKCFASSTEIDPSIRTFTTGATFTQWNSGLQSVPIQTSKRLIPSCASFSFLGSTPDNNTKQIMINYCQKFFTVNVNPLEDNPACIVCTDSTASIFASGYGFTNKSLTTCPLNRTSLNTRRLRFLSDYEKINEIRLLQNSNNSSSTNSSQIYIYNVCPVQDLICGSDKIGPDKSYLQYLNDFADSLNNSAAFSSLLGKNGVPVIGSPKVVQDNDLPILNFSIMSTFFLDVINLVAWKLSFYNPTQILCWWALGNDTTPTASSLQTECFKTFTDCGVVTVANTGAVIGNTTNIPLKWNSKYVVWAICSNNVPKSIYFSNITKIFTFTTPITNSTSISNNTVNVNNKTNTSTSTGSYERLNIPYWMVVIIILIYLII